MNVRIALLDETKDIYLVHHNLQQWPATYFLEVSKAEHDGESHLKMGCTLSIW